MTIGLSNSSKRSRYIGTTANRPTGGGDKKAGFPHMIGRESYTSVIMHSTDPVHGSCCTLKNYMTMKFVPSGRVYRNVGGNASVGHPDFKLV